jgi:hypothetical protein
MAETKETVALIAVIVIATSIVFSLMQYGFSPKGEAIATKSPCPLPDQDRDCVKDSEDNCPGVSNPDQSDTDHDGVGNACDNCPLVPNGDQTDGDGDGIGSACDGTESGGGGWQGGGNWSTPTCFITMEVGDRCSNHIDDDVDGLIDAPPTGNDPDCCPADRDACTETYISTTTGECVNLPIPDCQHCVLLIDCDDQNPETYNLCVSGRCIYYNPNANPDGEIKNVAEK